jgi:hypothetical protein
MFAMAAKASTVNVTDPSGPAHSVEVTAESLYKAAAMGLNLLKQDPGRISGRRTWE